MDIKVEKRTSDSPAVPASHHEWDEVCSPHFTIRMFDMHEHGRVLLTMANLGPFSWPADQPPPIRATSTFNGSIHLDELDELVTVLIAAKKHFAK